MQPPRSRPVSKPQVLVLSTLHQFHEMVACYPYSTLGQIINGVSPDALFLEVAEEDLRTRANEDVKREYPLAVYPLLDTLSADAYALEPSGRIRVELIQRKRRAEAEVAEPPPHELSSAFVNEWLEGLFSAWGSPLDANSAATDAKVRAKHELQDPMYPPDYARVWEEWNLCFYSRIVDVVERTQPRLALVLVGLEHSYWLRHRLAQCPSIELLQAEAALRDHAGRQAGRTRRLDGLSHRST